MPDLALLPLEEVIERLDTTVESSPADLTECTWVELVRGDVRSPSLGEMTGPRAETTVLVRVEEAGRIGVHRTGASSVGELSNAVRQALADARVGPKTAWRVPPARAGEHVEPAAELLDRELATLEPESAVERLGELIRDGETGRLSWTVGRIVLANSRGLRQQAAATSAVLELFGGPGPGAPYTAASSRSLSGLRLVSLAERFRMLQRHSQGEAAELPRQAVPAVLSPEVVAELLRLLDRHALSSSAFRTVGSLLSGRLGQRVLDPSCHLVDDATDAAGAPFPFDLFGYAKRPVKLIEAGVVRSPAVDFEMAQELGLPPTPHAISPEESRPEHLFLRPGGEEESDLLQRADGGVWIGHLEHVGCFDPARLRFTAVARGIRRVEGGRLGAAVPDCIWEDDVPRLLGNLVGIGSDAVCQPGLDGFWGAITTPAVAVPEIRLRASVS